MIESQFVTQLEICLLFFNRFLTASTHLMAPAVGKKLHVSCLPTSIHKAKGRDEKIHCHSVDPRFSFRFFSYANTKEKILFFPIKISKCNDSNQSYEKKNNG